MDETMTRSNTGIGNTGSASGDTGGWSSGGSVGNRSGMGGDVANRAREMANQYTENQPKMNPQPEHREGVIARSIEQQTAKIPSDAFLWAAVGSMGLSLALEIMGEEKKANFVGHWAPTLLIFGLYNKMVKLHGSDGA